MLIIMKKNIEFLFCGLMIAFLLYSCEDMMVEDKQQTFVETTMTRALAGDPSLDQLKGVPVWIELAQQYGAGKYVGLWHEYQPTDAFLDFEHKTFVKLKADNASSFHKFLIAESASQGVGKTFKVYTLQVLGTYSESPFNNQVIFLQKQWSSLNETNLIGNNYLPSNISSQSFSIVRVPETEDQYYILPWLVNIADDLRPNQLLLTARSGDDQSIIDLQKRTSSTEHLQRWRIVPAESFDLVNIVYSISSTDLVSQKPDFLTSVIVRNETSLEQSMEATFTEKATVSSSFTKNSGFRLNTSATVSSPKFLGMGANITVGMETSNSVSFNESESKEDQRSYKFPVRVPPYTIVTAEAAVQQYEANIGYTATFRGRSSGKNITVTGQWEGVTAGTITYTLRETSTNKILKTFTGVPKVEVDLNEILNK